jgi:hypothetical protein
MHWIFAHLIGEYLIQNDWMAFNKKNKSWICAVHVITYMIPFIFCDMAWWQLLAIAVEHFAQDRTRFVTWLMRVKGSWRFATGNAAPWSIIVHDNILHILWIALIVWIRQSMP